MRLSFRDASFLSALIAEGFWPRGKIEGYRSVVGYGVLINVADLPIKHVKALVIFFGLNH